MEQNKKEFPIRGDLVVLGLLIYFVLYNFVLPMFFSKLTLMQNPEATILPIAYQLSTYLITFFPLYFIMRPLLQKERHLQWKKIWITIVYCILIMLFINIVFGVFMQIVNGPQNSVNQEIINTLQRENPFFVFILTVLFAPLVEEFVFRGLIYRAMEYRFHFWPAAILSSFLFGFIHVMDSFLAAHFIDLIYLILYGMLGLVFAFAYRYNQSIYACILLHMAYNLIANL